MKQLRFIQIAIILFLASLFTSVESKACHFAAADIYVTYVGAGVDGCGTPDYKYEVTLMIYYACQECFGDNGANMSVSYRSATAVAQGDPLGSGTIPCTDATADPVTGDADTLHSLCAEFQDSNSCKSYPPNQNQPIPSRAENFPAYRVRTYVGNVTLPSGQLDWIFSWSSGARNVNNLVNSNSENIYVEAGLNNLTKYNNSTPRFVSNPLPYICINQPTTYLNGPFDFNGDSMAVFQQNPHNGPGGLIQYDPGFSVNDPIGSTFDNPYTLNPITGAATFTPTSQGFFVFGFRAEDYERGTGIKLGHVYRDVQVSVLPCTAPPPGIDSTKQIITSIKNATVVKTPSQGDMFFVCPGSEMEFNITSSTDSVTHKVYVTANTNLIPGSSFSSTGQGTNRVDGVFKWTPTTSQIGDHSLVIISKDSTCKVWQPIVLTNYRVVLIRVLNGLDAGPDQPTCEINPSPVQMFVYNTDYLRLKWNDVNGGPAIGLSNDTIHNPIAFTSVAREYVISTPDLAGTCKSRDSVIIFLNKDNDVVITPKNPVNPDHALVMCRPGYLQLEATPVGRPPKNNVNCGIGSPTVCTVEDTTTIFGSMIYGKLNYDTVGNATPIFQNTLFSTRMQYLVNKNDMRNSSMFAATIRGLAFESKGTSTPNHVYANFRIQLKCTEKEELKAIDGFESEGMTEVYYAASITLPDGEHYYTFNTPYNWDTSKNLIVQICYSDNPTVVTGCGVTSTPPRLRFVPTAGVSGLVYKAPDATTLNICGVEKSNDIIATSARPLLKFTYCEANPLKFNTFFRISEQGSDTSIPHMLAYIPKSTHFVAETRGRSNCIMRDTLYVYVPENDYKISPEDTSICLGDKAPLMVYGGHFFKWYEYENGQYLPPASVHNPVSNYTFIGPDKTTEYRIVVSDSVFCYDTLSARVRVMPLPDVRILNQDDTTVRYGQQFQLLASGARLYNWSPVSSLNNPNISYPIARPTEDTKYIVGGIGANGCRAFDTLHVIVDKRDNLFVPSAFSPNGDGRNDVFRITNLSFKRIMEFRVFNRWGQEVYSTNDSRAGWDGTWGGVPQDMGVYTYLIRVAYPDGFVETYRGETSLIR